MSFELKVGGRYDYTREPGFAALTSVMIVGKKSDHKHKCIFVADNGLSYSPDGYVIGYQEHIADLQPRIRALG
jgi:hypothetical protein